MRDPAGIGHSDASLKLKRKRTIGCNTPSSRRRVLWNKDEDGSVMAQLAIIHEKLSDKVGSLQAFTAEDLGRKLLTEAGPYTRLREE